MAITLDDLTIAKWVGHRNTKMIEEVYGHLQPEFCQDQMNKFRSIDTNGIAKPVEQIQATPPPTAD